MSDKEEQKKEKFGLKEQMNYGIAKGITQGNEIGMDALKDAGQKFERWKLKVKIWWNKIRS